jgi:hypothetical protein
MRVSLGEIFQKLHTAANTLAYRALEASRCHNTRYIDLAAVIKRSARR